MAARTALWKGLLEEFPITTSTGTRQDVVDSAGPQPDLLEALLRAAGDPECAVPNWLRGHTPLGITQPIEEFGIFPPAGADYLASEDPDVDGAWFPSEDGANYSSFVEFEGLAVAELQKDIEHGFVEWRPSHDEF